MLKTKMKRITLHPLLEDGSMDTSVNLYPKTLIDGIVDREGNSVEVQEKLIAGKNITIENNVISATGGESGIDIPEFKWDTREELSQEILDDIYSHNYPFIKFLIADDEGTYFPVLMSLSTEIPGRVDLVDERGREVEKDYRLRMYTSTFATGEVENKGHGGSYDWGSDDYGSEDPSGLRIDEGEQQLIIFYIAKIEDIAEYLYTVGDETFGISEGRVENMLWNFWDTYIRPYIDEHGAGDVRGQQMTATIIQNALTNINGRYLEKYNFYEETIEGYKALIIEYQHTWMDQERAASYMEFMTGSRYVPEFDYERPKNSIFIMADGSFWKPQWDNSHGMVLWAIPSPYSTKYNITGNFDISSGYIDVKSEVIQSILAAKPTSILINNYYEVYLQCQDTEWNNALTYVGIYINQDDQNKLRAPAQETCLYTIKFEYDGYSGGYFATLKKISLGGGSDITYATDQDIDNLFIKYCNISYTLDAGISMSTQPSEILQGNLYQSDVYVDYPHYYISTISITLDGNDITNLYLPEYGRNVWDGNNILIPSVKGDYLDIKISTIENPDAIYISSSLENASTNPSIPEYVVRDGSIKVLITPNWPYTGLEVHVYDTWYNDVTDQVYTWDEANSTGRLDIYNIQNTYTINVVGIGGTNWYNVIFDLSNVEAQNQSTLVEEGSEYYNRFTFINGATEFSDKPAIYMGSQDIATSEYFYQDDKSNDWILTIPHVSDELTIRLYATGEAPSETYNISYWFSGSGIETTNSTNTAYKGSNYETVIYSKDKFYGSVKMSGTVYMDFNSKWMSDNDRYEVHIYIGDVQGDIDIYADYE